MPYAKLNNLRFFYEDHGPTEKSGKNPATLVFLHGFTLDHRMWGPQVPCFEKQYRVIIPDARGHGLSDAPRTGYSRAHRVEDLERLRDHLGIDRFHLIALSMGGVTAIGYALKHQQRLRSLTLVSTGAAGYPAVKRISRIDQIAREQGIAAAKQKWKEVTLSWYTHHQAGVKNLMQIMMDEHTGAFWRDPMRGKYPRGNDLEQVHGITVPTLISAGEHDTMFAPLARRLHERITNSKIRVYPETGHMVNLEAPEQLNRDLQRFLDSVNQS